MDNGQLTAREARLAVMPSGKMFSSLRTQLDNVREWYIWLRLLVGSDEDCHDGGMAKGKQSAGSSAGKAPAKAASNAPVVTKAERRAREVLARCDRHRAEAARNGQKRKAPPVVQHARATIAEVQWRTAQTPAMPQCENRQRRRELSRTDQDIFNSGHDPISCDRGDW